MNSFVEQIFLWRKSCRGSFIGAYFCLAKMVPERNFARPSQWLPMSAYFPRVSAGKLGEKVKSSGSMDQRVGGNGFSGKLSPGW